MLIANFSADKTTSLVAHSGIQLVM